MSLKNELTECLLRLYCPICDNTTHHDINNDNYEADNLCMTCKKVCDIEMINAPAGCIIIEEEE